MLVPGQFRMELLGAVVSVRCVRILRCGSSLHQVERLPREVTHGTPPIWVYLPRAYVWSVDTLIYALPFFQISPSYVAVVRQSTLITFTFFLCWFWNGLFRMLLFAQGAIPSWIIPLQVIVSWRRNCATCRYCSSLVCFCANECIDILAGWDRLRQFHHMAALH